MSVTIINRLTMYKACYTSIMKNKTLAPLALRQANLRRWLDARVPVGGNHVELEGQDAETLKRMIHDQKLPITAVLSYSGNDPKWEVVVDEGISPISECYVLETNLGSFAAVYNWVNMNLGGNRKMIPTHFNF